MVRETWVQSQVESYQRFKKWYLIPPVLTLSNIRYISKSRFCSYWKGSLLVALDNGRQQLLYIKSQVGDLSREWPEGSVFNSYYIKAYVRALFIPSIAQLYPWSLPYNAECQVRQRRVPFFESLVWLDVGLNPGFPDNWWILWPLGKCSGLLGSWVEYLPIIRKTGIQSHVKSYQRLEKWYSPLPYLTLSIRR